MVGQGKDFMVVDAITQPFRLRPALIRELADRSAGVGFAQLLVVEPPGLPDVDFRYRAFNADGTEAEQYGNGALCFSRFVREQRLTNKNLLWVQTASGVLRIRILKDGVEVSMDETKPHTHSETDEAGTVTMRGPATSVFEGQLRLPGESGGNRRRKPGRPNKQRS